MQSPPIENPDFESLLLAVYNQYGFDFRHYARASLKRRVKNFMEKKGIEQISDIIPRIIENKDFFNSFIYHISVTVTEMFRDPLVFLALRELVVPFLKTHPFCKFWVAGCATGEEVYSLAILLHEEGLLDRSQIYATDMNDESLKKARDAIYPLKEIKKYSENYLKAGGKRTLSEYYHSKYNNVIINSQLKKNITFANHNLVMDWVFGEMNLILCRNVLIYFAQELQNRVLRLFYESLGRSGYLCLGNKEDIRFLELARHFEKAHASEKIYKKIFVI